MSYQSSKHPGLYLYLTLVTATILSFLFLEISSTAIGILTILWGGFTALRALSLYEISSSQTYNAKRNTLISKEHNAQSSLLAYDLIQRMTTGANTTQGLRALYCLHERTLLWGTIAITYMAFSLHLNASNSGQTALMEMVCTMFMIGTAFWGGQSYAYNNKAAKLMGSFFAIFLCLSLFVFKVNIFPAHLLSAFSQAIFYKSTTSNILLLILALYSTTILLHALMQQNKATPNAIAGICIIAIMSVSYLSIESTQATTALWLSGWGLFSIFWSRAHQPVRKRYILYQSD
ncbi:MAG: hypothetical protein ACLFP8_06190 [Alphaproteobacteria bacterium]